MKAALYWSLAACVALAAPAHAQHAGNRAEPVEAPSDDDRQGDPRYIGFRVGQDERMTVQVRIEGRGPFRFLVDTGATRTVVSTAIADRLALTIGPVARLHSTGGTSLVSTAIVPRLELGPGRVRHVEAALLEATDMGADGIIGVDSLRSDKVIFDFRTRLISIVPPRQRMRDEQGTVVVRGKLKQGHLIVTSAAANRVPLTAILDTGSDITMGNAALRHALERRGRLGAPERLSMKSVTGEILQGDAFHMRNVTVGGAVLHDLVILFAASPIFHRLGFEDRPAMLIGMNALRGFDQVTIDFAAKRLRMIVPGAQP